MIDYQIENHFVGCLVAFPEEIKAYYNFVKPQMLQSIFCKSIYKMICKMFEKGEEIDIDLLSNNLSKDSDLTAKEWHDKIYDMATSECLSYNLKGYSQAIIKEYQSRELLDFLAKQQISSLNIQESMADIQTFVEKLKVNNATSHKLNGAELSKLSNECCFVDREEKDLLFTGLDKLDEYIRLEPCEVVVLGARPSVGKSALALQIAWNNAKKGKKVAYFNLEMNPEHIVQRLISLISGIEILTLMNAKCMLGDQEKHFRKAQEEIKQSNFNCFTGSFSELDIIAECKFSEYDLVVIDYLQLIRCATRTENNRRVEVGAVSRKIKEMAMELKVPVIVLSQLSRNSEYKPDREPSMADLRETGDIEQDASVILLMWNLSDDLAYRRFKGLKVAKNRQGNLIAEGLGFKGNVMTFEEIPKDLKEIRQGIEEKTMLHDVTDEDEIPFS